MEQVTNKSVYSFNYVDVKTNFLKVVRQGVQVGTDTLPCNSSIVITIIFKECQYIKVEICILNSLNIGEPRHRKVENANAESCGSW